MIRKAISIKSNPVLERELELLKTLSKLRNKSVDSDKLSYKEALNVFMNSKVPFTYSVEDIPGTSLKNLCTLIGIKEVYNFPIVNTEDILAYRSIFQLYAKDYEGCLNSLYSLEQILLNYKGQYLDCNEAAIYASEICGFKFSIMSLNECYYTMLICYLLLGRHTEALNIVTQMTTTIKPEVLSWILLVRLALQYKAAHTIQLSTADIEALKKLPKKVFDSNSLVLAKSIRLDFDNGTDSFRAKFEYLQIAVGEITIVRHSVNVGSETVLLKPDGQTNRYAT